MKSELAQAVANFAALMDGRGFPVRLHPPATEQDIAAAEKRLGLRFPAELRELYLIANGSAGGLMLSYPLYSLDELTEQYAGWHDLIFGSGGMAGDNLIETLYASQPPQTVQLRYWLPGWLPLCGDGNGNHVALDLSPAERGTPGQLITMGADEDDHQQLALSLSGFFRLSFSLIFEQAVTLSDEGHWETAHHFNPFAAFAGGMKVLGLR